jgi:protein TonB
VADLLRVIRQKIEREHARAYPETAGRKEREGTVELRFRIAPDGSVETIEVVRSSGHRLLDEASAQTVRRAGPYPPVAGWIRIPLSYRLDQ